MKGIQLSATALVVMMVASSCLNDEPIKLEYQGFQPVSRGDGWEISSPASENMDPLLVEKAFQLLYLDDRYVMARGLLVVRNGRLVAEVYPHSLGDIDRIENIQSSTKSFTSVLTGIALEKGFLDSLNQPLSQICPDAFTNHPEKTDITLRHALTMQTGINFDNDEDALDFYHASGSSVEFVLSKTQEYAPGVIFRYNDGAPQLVSAAIQRRSGKQLSAFAEEHLFTPLQIVDWKWESAKDGITFGAFSLFLTPRDLAKWGLMLLNNGSWNGQQVVDSAWIAEATQPLVNAGSYGASYGYYFWVYPGYEGYAAVGHGGQRVFAVPSKSLLIVYTAWPYTSDKLFDEFAELADLIVASCR